MNEIFPIVAGLGAGIAVERLCARHRWLVLATTSVVIGILAGLISGELARSIGFLLVDVPEALVAGAVVLTVAPFLGLASHRQAR